LKLVKSILKYAVTLAVAFLLLWYVYRDQDIYSMIERLQDVDFQWIIYSYILAILGNSLRSYRWNLLLKPIGYQLKTFRTFLAVMVGYFTNLVIPRAGEISRCAILKKTDNVNMAHSIGTVVAERAVDLVMLILVVIVAFVVEFDLFYQYIGGSFDGNIFQLTWDRWVFITGIALVLILASYFLIRKFKKKLNNSTVYSKMRHIVGELAEGFTSIKNMDKLAGFVVSTILIWVLYFLMSYVAFYAIPETSHLGFRTGLSILAMSSLSMLVPVQGGIGAYHFLITQVLISYGIAEHDGVFFAGLLHGSQVLLVAVLGGASFIISILIEKRDARKKSGKLVI
jgi:glycosyltransferase 2 family protein